MQWVFYPISDSPYNWTRASQHPWARKHRICRWLGWRWRRRRRRRGRRLALDDHRRTVADEPLVPGHAEVRSLALPLAGLAAQLPGELADLRDRLRGDGLAEAGEPAARVHRDAASEAGVAVAQQALGLAGPAQAD